SVASVELDQIDLRWTWAVVRLFTPFLRWYYRVEVKGLENLAGQLGSALFVANHNAGYVLDILAILYALKPWQRHDLKMVGMGRGGPVDAAILKQIIQKIGGIPDSTENARFALRQKCWVLVCPGGVRGVIRPIWMRNRISFDWQRGYVRLAQSEGSPLFPVA